MVVNYQIESSPLSSIIANLNPFATLPTTSKGAGEIIHYTGDNTIRWNSQTVNPTTNPIWSNLSAGGVSDHGALTGLTDDDHTQYLLADGSRSLTGDLTFNKLAPSIIFDTNDLIEYDKSSNAFNFNIAGVIELYLSATDLIARTNISFLKTDPVLQFDTNDYFKYINASNALQLLIASTIEYEFTASALDLKNNSLNNANIPGTDSALFIIDQDNAGAGVSSSLRFNRGSTDGDASIWWDEGDDEFQFESDVGVTVGSILIDECRHGGSVKTSRNPSTGDYEIEVAEGDSIVFKAV